MDTSGAEDARKHLPELLERAYRNGKTTIITKRGKPYAAIAPLPRSPNQAAPKLSALRGSARGLYGDAAGHVARARDEWD